MALFPAPSARFYCRGAAADLLDLSDLRSGKRSSIARAISAIENDPIQARLIIGSIFGQTGGSTVVGFTGPAGAGKSSLIDRTVSELKILDAKPAVLAVDPTSHVTGGAILGDRMRMTESADAGVYIRSIASRGATGAVSWSLRNSIRVLEYARFDPVIIESVGAGQTEVEISNIADVTIVVFNPNTGDSIQTIKAGLTEIGDIYLINKGDLPGASRLFDAVRDHIGTGSGGPAVLKVSAKTGKGMHEFLKTLRMVITEKRAAKPKRAADSIERELRDVILNNIHAKFDAMLSSNAAYRRCLRMVLDGKTDPYKAADEITESLVG